MVVRILDSRGSGSTKTLAAGIRYAAANGARIINLSLETSTDDPRVRAAVKAAAAANVLVVCSAGNTGAERRPAPALSGLDPRRQPRRRRRHGARRRR